MTTRLLTLVLLSLGISAPAVRAADAAKEKVIVVSPGDIIGDPRFAGMAQLDTPENVTKAALLWKQRGVDKVLFRVDDWRLQIFHKIYMPGGWTL